MRRTRLVLLGMAEALLLGSLGCGGGGGGSATHSPSLSNLSLTPSVLYQGAGGGTATVSASFSFADAGGDLASIKLTVRDGAGAVLQTLTEPITGAAGARSGTLFGQVNASTTRVDVYAFQISVVDMGNSSSHVLSGTFQVATPPVMNQPAMPTPRDRVSTAAVGSVIYVLGGGNPGGGHFTTVEAFDTFSGLWSSLPAMGTQRDGAVAGAIGGKVYVAAGGLSRTTEVYDPALGTWSTVAQIPTERQGAAGCELGGKLYVLGGNQGLDLQAVEAYDPALDTWTTCAPLPVARSWAGACALNGKLYVVGGYDGSAMVSPWLSRLDIYDPATNTWSSGPPVPIFPGVYQHAVVALGGRVVVFGGANASRGLDSIYQFDPATGVWSMGARLPRVMSQFGAAVTGGKAYLFDSLGSFSYDPAKDLGPLN